MTPVVAPGLALAECGREDGLIEVHSIRFRHDERPHGNVRCGMGEAHVGEGV